MNNFFFFSNAKINLTLDVLSKQDKYHELDMIVAPIKIKNKISVEITNNKDKININNKNMRGTNIEKVLVAARKYVDVPFFNVKIDQNILEGAGLGSSSADAAAMLRFLCDKYKLNSDIAFNIGEKIGSDIPCMFINKPCHVFGTGNYVEPIYNLNFPKKVTIVSNNLVFVTKEIFKIYDKVGSTTSYTKKSIDSNTICHGNCLEKAAMILSDEFSKDLNFCKSYFNKVVMTGSGSAIVVIDELTSHLKDILKNNFKYVEEVELI